MPSSGGSSGRSPGINSTGASESRSDIDDSLEPTANGRHRTPGRSRIGWASNTLGQLDRAGRLSMVGGRFAILVIALGMLASACAPAGGTSSQATTPAQPRAPKTLTIAQEFEPPDIEGFGSLVRPAGSGGLREIAHNHLVRKIRDGVIQPELAAIPSLDDGSWRVSADGSMDMTWRLQPNVKWHDGTAFSSADMVFSL